jgi:hypothetical protein
VSSPGALARRSAISFRAFQLYAATIEPLLAAPSISVAIESIRVSGRDSYPSIYVVAVDVATQREGFET